MVGHKPLPPVPINLTTLTIDARTHRGRLVRHLLTEAREPGLEGQREGWAVALEDALDELGRRVSKGDWLNDVRKAHEARSLARRRRRGFVDKAKSEGVVQSKKSSVQDDGELLSIEPKENGSFEVLPELNQLPSEHARLENEKFLLLCVTPLGSQLPIPSEDSGFNLVPANIGCTFASGTFSLQDTEYESSTILYGNKQWTIPTLGGNTKIIGGTFTFKGITSIALHRALFKILRVAIYVHLSLILEQHLLSDANVPLLFPRPKFPSPSSSTPDRPSVERAVSSDTKRKKHASFLPSGILSFFSKNNMSHRSSTIMPILGRGGSLDLVKPSPYQPKQEEGTPRSSVEAGVSRLRRFSIMGDRRPSLKDSTESSSDTKAPFSSILKQIEDSAGLLSTSPGVLFHPPTLIVDLAEKERVKPSRRLKGDEKSGLFSLLGWEGRDSRGRGMSGKTGFLRHQGLSVLLSSHVPRIDADKTLAHLSTDPGKAMLFAVCEQPTWKTYQYYLGDPDGDDTLGETIADFVNRAEEPCDRPGCTYKNSQHELRLIHDGILITIKVTKVEEDKISLEDKRVDVWESCRLCDSESRRREMSDGTYLISFGKFLELLIYSPALCSSNSILCEHTAPPPRPWPTLPTSRLNVVRHFFSHTHTVSFSLSIVEYIFELRVPQLQITRGHGDKSSKESVASKLENQPEVDEDKKELRRQIKRWWEGVVDHLDKLEATLSDESSGPHKTLPRLPSSDDAYGDIEVESEPARSPKLDPSLIGSPILPLSAPVTPPSRYLSEYFPSTPTVIPGAPPSSPFQMPTNQPIYRLSNMRHTFQRTERALYTQLLHTPPTELNDIRRSFLYAAKGAHKRLEAWQKKHLNNGSQTLQDFSTEEPEWWGKGCHVMPGGNVVVREDDWGSIISFTLSTADYQHELANMSTQRSSAQPFASESSPALSSQSSLFSAAVGYRLFSSSTHTQPDPDREDITWSEPEAFSSVISRKEHPRDPTTILSIREVLRQKSPVDVAIPTASRFGSFGPAGSKTIVPPSAWAKPDVQINKDPVGGEVSNAPDIMDSAGKILQEIESVSESSKPSSRTPSIFMGSNIMESHIRRSDSPSIISIDNTSTIGRAQGSTIKLNMPPPPPPKDLRREEKLDDALDNQSVGHTTTSSLAGTLASGLNSAMRFMLNGRETPRPTSPYGQAHHGLLSADVTNIDERPHIKYDWTVGTRLKFSCTVYYAKQFDVLRRRCGISDLYVKSLSRSKNWAADGGKSRSNFWKTSDDRLIIKTLVNAWNVADLQVLIEMAPSYFRYMDATTSKATVLAKMLGFYTIEIRNLETGAIQSRSDLLVMENLFYNQSVSKTFDLKGIQGRKVKPGNIREPRRSKTLFDGEWIEDQQKALMLVRPHSKQVLHAAIKSDTEYLSRSNIMDYSLLVGIDEERKQIACGLVDTIGSYTFAKTLEYKAKHGLTSGKDITVMPPTEYQERFVSALEGYFLACPDKWSKPSDESKILNDISQLPSVL